MGQSGKYFNASSSAKGITLTGKRGEPVKPIIPAAKQHDAVFADASILFDWTEFQVPKGSNRLLSVIAIVRGTDGVAQGALPFDLIFGRSIDGVAPSSLGTVGAAVTEFNWANNIIGLTQIVANDYTDADMVVLRIAKTSILQTEMVLTGEPISGVNVGYDTLYVAAIAKAQFDFRGTAEVKTSRDAAAIADGTTKQLEVTAKSAIVNFAVGDTLHSQVGKVLGKVKSIEGTDDLTFLKETVGTGISDIHVDGEFVYNINPIALIFGFEA